jgi:transposase-like protein
MDEELGKWRNRKLGHTPYLILDARYENVRHGGVIVRCSILVALGIRLDGRRTVLGVSVSLSEAEIHWRDFLLSLKERGMHGIEMISSDDHAGLKAALKSTMPSVPWNRCQFHLQQNAGHYAPKKSMRKDIAEDIRGVFNAPNRTEADRLLEVVVKKYEKSAPKLSKWMEGNIPEGLVCFKIPAKFRRRLRTTNMLERLNQEIKRRTRVANMFPNESSALRLISAILMDVSDNWETGRIYLNFD